MQLIIPPLLVVLSIVGIILFLLKKAPAARRLAEKNRLAEQGANQVSIQEAEEKDSQLGMKMKNVALIILEKTARKFRVFFLKLENKSTILSEKIRKKRSEGARREEVVLEKEALDGVVSRDQGRMVARNGIRRMLKMRQDKSEELEEKYFRPIVSDNVVTPKRRREIKNRLEEILIERIAANPKDVEAYERLGEYYFEIKNLEHAKECFKQAIRLNPFNRGVRYKMKKLEKLLDEKR